MLSLFGVGTMAARMGKDIRTRILSFEDPGPSLEEAIEKDPERYQGILESFCEGPRSLVTWFANERSILEVFLNLFARFELLKAYSEVVKEIYELYRDDEKRESYLEEIILHCPKTFSTYRSSKKHYADYVLLIATKKLLSLPLGDMPKTKKELFDEIRSYVVYRVSNFFGRLDASSRGTISIDRLDEKEREEFEALLWRSKSLYSSPEEIYLLKEEARERLLNLVTKNLEALMGYVSKVPQEDRAGWILHLLGAPKKRAFGDKRRGDRATKRMQRALSQDYQAFESLISKIHEQLENLSKAIELGILEKEIIIAVMRDVASTLKKIV